MKRLSVLALAAAFCLALSCRRPMPADKKLMMATTTSTQDSGLLEYLQPTFKAETGIDLKWVAVGTGKALEIAKNCDADVLLVHAPPPRWNSSKPGTAWTAARSCITISCWWARSRTGPGQGQGHGRGPQGHCRAQKPLCEPRRPVRHAQGRAQALEGLQPVAGQGSLVCFRRAGHDGHPEHGRREKGLCLTDRGTWIKFANKQGDKNPLASWWRATRLCSTSTA